MPRIADESSLLLADLHSRLQRVLEAAHQEGRTSALNEIRNLVGGGGATVPVRRGPGRPKGSKNAPKAAAATPVDAKPKKKRKNPWAGMTAEQKKERVRKMLAGRGLKPKGER